MHYLPLLMHGDTPINSIKSPFYLAFDGRDLAVCFCTDKDFAQEQIEISRAQHFGDDYEGEWGLGMFEFGSIEQVMVFVEKWNILVATKLGMKSPTALALWTATEPHRYIKFSDILKHAKEPAPEPAP